MASVGEFVRELLIKIGISGGPEARAEVDATAASLAKISEAEGAVTAASAEASAAQKETAAGMEAQAAASAGVTTALQGQAVAAGEVETILEMKARIAAEAAQVELDADARLAEAHLAASFAMQKLAETTSIGGKQMATALEAATIAVSQFEIAIARAQTVNASLVSPATQQLLQQYDGTIKGLSSTLEKGATQQKMFGVEAAVMRDSVGGAARGIASMGGEVAGAILPIGAAVIGIDILLKVIKDIDEKSKAWAADLVGLALGLHEEDIAVRKSGESQEAYELRLQKVMDVKDQMTRAQYAMGAGLIQEETDVGKAVVAWEAYKFAHGAAIQQLPELEKAAKAMGLSFRATHEEMTREAQIFFSIYEGLLKKEGQQAADAWATANKATLDKIVSEYQRAGLEVPASLSKIVTALNLVTAADKEAAASKGLHDKFIEDANVTTVLYAEIQRLAAVMGSEEAAVKALAPQILAEIKAKEQLKTTNAADEATRKASLASLLELAAKYGLVEGAMGKTTAAADKAVASFKEHQAKLAELNNEYDNHVKAVTMAADKSIAALNREADAVRTTMSQELVDLRKARDDGSISNQEYFEKTNLLVAAMNLAADAAQAERERINTKERDDLDKLAEKHHETAGKIEEEQKNITAAGARAAESTSHFAVQLSTDFDPVNREIAAVGQSFVDMATRAAEAGQKVGPAWDTSIPALKNIEIAADLAATKLDGVATAAGAAGQGLERGTAGGLQTAVMMLRLQEAADGLPGILSKIGEAAISTFGGGGGVPEQFGPPTPAPTPTGSAPGTEFED